MNIHQFPKPTSFNRDQLLIEISQNMNVWPQTYEVGEATVTFGFSKPLTSQQAVRLGQLVAAHVADPSYAIKQTPIGPSPGNIEFERYLLLSFLVTKPYATVGEIAQKHNVPAQSLIKAAEFIRRTGFTILPTFWATLLSVDIANKRVTVERTIAGKTLSLQCGVTRSMIRASLDGAIALGDKVLVAFVDNDPSKPIVLDKVVV